ncbi:hypothetical protein COW36_23820 [bacterium (Candidatus Blackallbacteria) CG17_big_fil_post_rev_8_21_14_2_50_48_46]|uniref:Uncharacterized protein n=1 Tax=bacterium (Candidatus Blackallbacteria) CG17_big_fil_post_rev_8_21_14_2_50_48_46 TaxID=2014261 RepID=A0A2M7FX96_9BACT|nr:MAG: hypothetical protein COW64_18760 [bacterium (Candidatus Blackallbacteria) CG18_big_fil_WC_8_21_14_2_50_49_26]PIW13702.1 MAG: hypothetical protein COW36_23820 [bacterium (Candidatus Blackallbacteria) CG17_big_fil_post_rev_8_21_14_2_50_48_46]PIW44928.1 MAG: hypothetical protein COW20_21450 [bacterium (Candidatus Blackallbacteria) CG13_big_fil_rev_8_21_14_2_50_49_14]
MKPVEKISFCIQESWVLNALAGLWGGVIVVLALLDIFLNYLEWTSIGALQRLVNVSQDDGLVNWFSSIQLFCIALVLWGVFAVLLTQKQTLKRFVLWGWGFIASFFSYLALDDGSRLHERIGTAVEETFKGGGASGGGFFSELVKHFPSFHWQLVFVPALVCIGFFVMWFMWKNLNSREQKILLFLGLSLYGFAVVLDFIEGVESIYTHLAASLGVKTYVISHLSILIEECSEMFGNTLIMLAFLKQLTSQAGNWSVRVVSSAFPESAENLDSPPPLV